MDTFIYKTNISSDSDFHTVKKTLTEKKSINECTIDLLDVDKVLRVVSDSFTVAEIENEVMNMGYYCKELEG